MVRSLVVFVALIALLAISTAVRGQDPPQPAQPDPVVSPVMAAHIERLKAELPDRMATLSEELRESAHRWNRSAPPKGSKRKSARIRKGSARDKYGLTVAENTAQLGLGWLAAHQSPKGFWSGAGFEDSCGRIDDGAPCGGTGSNLHDPGVTGLALLCFLRSGVEPPPAKETGDDENDAEDISPYAFTVAQGIDFLIAVQSSNGRFGSEHILTGNYDHHIATLAMIEAALVTGAEAHKESAEKAIDHILAERNAGAAWRYAQAHPEMRVFPNDTSVTAWALQALEQGRAARMPFDKTAFTDGLGFIHAMTDPVTGRTGYTHIGMLPPREVGSEFNWPSQQTESLTAAGLYCRLLAIENRTLKHDKQALELSTELLVDLPPVWDLAHPGRVDYYYWYYGTKALALQGGDAWLDWKQPLINVFAQHTLLDGDALGSWDPARDPWGHVGGRIYSTAMMTLSALESSQH